MVITGIPTGTIKQRVVKKYVDFKDENAFEAPTLKY